MGQVSRTGGEAFAPHALKSWCASVLQQAGLEPEDASTAASVLVHTEARGGATHGFSRLRTYLDKLASGEIAPRAQPKLEQNHAFLRIDAERALGQVAGPFSVSAAVAATNEHPAVICSVRNAGHLGALGIHLLRAAEAGRVALLMQSTPPLMSLPGGAGPMLGNNPLAIAAPRTDGPPIVIDLACSVAARGNILIANRTREPIPDGWALDLQGRPTTDPAEALKGSLMPFGGVKGLMIAAMVELLAGSLSGALFESSMNANGQVRSAPGGVNAFLLVLNPKLMNGWSEYCAHVDAWTANYLKAGGPDARIPGERAFAQERESEIRGIAFVPGTLADLRLLANELGCSFPNTIPGNEAHPNLQGR